MTLDLQRAAQLAEILRRDVDVLGSPGVHAASIRREVANTVESAAKEIEQMRSMTERSERDVVTAIVRWLDDMHFTQPGRESEWTRFIASGIAQGKWKR